MIVSNCEDSLYMTMATRLYPQMNYFGRDDLAILDGGREEWVQDRREVVSTPPDKETKDGHRIAKTEREDMLATTQEVEDAVKAGDVQLVDNRSIRQCLGVYKSRTWTRRDISPEQNPFPMN